MHVIGRVWSNEVIAGNLVALQVRGQFPVGPDVIRAPGQVGCDVVEKDKWIVPDNVRIVVGQRAVAGIEIFLIALPGNARLFQHRDQMVGRAGVLDGRRLVVENSEVGSGLQPDVIRRARMQIGRREVLLGARGDRQQGVVEVGTVGVAADVRPIVVFHQNEKNGLNVGQRIGPEVCGEEKRAAGHQANHRGMGPRCVS